MTSYCKILRLWGSGANLPSVDRTKLRQDGSGVAKLVPWLCLFIADTLVGS